MLIDIVFAILLITALIKGFSKGLIVAVFSLLAFIIGLAAALKLWAVVAAYLQKDMQIIGRWLPFLSFAIVFIAVVFLIRWMAAFLKRTVSLVLLGWVDTIGGILFYALAYLMIFSIVLFYATQLQIIGSEAAIESKTYHLILPWGPRVINGIGVIFPWFSNLFSDLTLFFSGVSDRIK